MKQLRGARTIDRSPNWRSLEQMPQPQIRLPPGIPLVAEIAGNDERIAPVDSEPCTLPDVESDITIAETAVVPYAAGVHESDCRKPPGCTQEVEPGTTHPNLEVAHSARPAEKALSKDTANRFGST